MFQKRPRRSQRIRPARSNGAKPIIRLNHVAVPRKQEGGFRISHDQQRLKMPQRPVRPPFLSQLDSRPRQIPMKFLQFVLKSREKRQRVPGTTSKSSNNL